LFSHPAISKVDEVTNGNPQEDVMERRMKTNGTELSVRVTGDGPPLVLLHGWPHTGRIWEPLIPLLPHRTIIAPDLRGLGDSEPASGRHDAATGADDVRGLLDALDLADAELAAIDAAVPTAFLLATRHPERIRRLVLMEGLLPGLPGGFAVPPWWFGFHAVPGLAESVLAGNEAAYLDFFLTSGSHRGVPPEIRAAFVRAHTGHDRLRNSFAFYRAMARNAELILGAGRLTVPTVAIGGSAVGDRLHRQLAPITDDLRGEVLERCAHLVPIDRPDALAQIFGRAEPSPGVGDGPA
jgi:pimeloyl-ACP methyl ester carboxylesterase